MGMDMFFFQDCMPHDHSEHGINLIVCVEKGGRRGGGATDATTRRFSTPHTHNLGQDKDCSENTQHLNYPESLINQHLYKKAMINKEHLPMYWNTTKISGLVTVK